MMTRISPSSMIGIQQDTSVYAKETPPPTLKCRVCGEEKSSAEFAKRGKGRYGLDKRCSLCAGQYYSSYFQANRERANELRRARRASERLGADKKFGNSWQGLTEAFTQMRAE